MHSSLLYSSIDECIANIVTKCCASKPSHVLRKRNSSHANVASSRNNMAVTGTSSHDTRPSSSRKSMDAPDHSSINGSHHGGLGAGARQSPGVPDAHGHPASLRPSSHDAGARQSPSVPDSPTCSAHHDFLNLLGSPFMDGMENNGDVPSDGWMYEHSESRDRCMDVPCESRESFEKSSGSLRCLSRSTQSDRVNGTSPEDSSARPLPCDGDMIPSDDDLSKKLREMYTTVTSGNL